MEINNFKDNEVYKFLDSIGYTQYYQNFYNEKIVNKQDFIDKINKELLIKLIPIAKHRKIFLHRLKSQYKQLYDIYNNSSKRNNNNNEIPNNIRGTLYESDYNIKKLRSNEYVKEYSNNYFINKGITIDKSIVFIENLIKIREYFNRNPFKCNNMTLDINTCKLYNIDSEISINNIKNNYKLFVKYDILNAYKFYTVFYTTTDYEDIEIIVHQLSTTIDKYIEISNIIIINSDDVYYIMELDNNNALNQEPLLISFKFLPFKYNSITICNRPDTHEIIYYYAKDTTKNYKNIFVQGERHINSVTNSTTIYNRCFLDFTIYIKVYSNNNNKLINTILCVDKTVLIEKSSNSFIKNYNDKREVLVLNSLLPFITNDELFGFKRFSVLEGKYKRIINIDRQNMIIDFRNKDAVSIVNNSKTYLYIAIKLKYTFLGIYLSSNNSIINYFVQEYKAN